jgi:hypothetical protein
MPQKEGKMKQKDIPEAQIAWVLSNVLDEITERLWLRYGKDFIRWEKEQEREDLRTAEGAKDQDPLAQDDF